MILPMLATAAVATASGAFMSDSGAYVADWRGLHGVYGRPVTPCEVAKFGKRHVGEKFALTGFLSYKWKDVLHVYSDECDVIFKDNEADQSPGMKQIREKLSPGFVGYYLIGFVATYRWSEQPPSDAPRLANGRSAKTSQKPHAVLELQKLLVSQYIDSGFFALPGFGPVDTPPPPPTPEQLERYKEQAASKAEADSATSKSASHPPAGPGSPTSR